MTTDTNGALLELSLGLREKAKNKSFYDYVPHSKQTAFHQRHAKGKLFLGGNRSGKTVAGLNEALVHSSTWPPGLRRSRGLPEPPVFGRIVTTDNVHGKEGIILPLLRQWVPKDLLIDSSFDKSYSKQNSRLTLVNGSTIEIMTHEMDVEAFAGVPRHWTWFDEECPQAIFDECMMRLLDYDGYWWMTMTPLLGLTWVHSEFLEHPKKDVFVIFVDSYDNPHLPKEALDDIFEGMSTDEIAQRRFGQFKPKGGLIYPEFSQEHIIEDINLDDYLDDPSWKVLVSMDHGYNNPSAWLFALYDQGEDELIIFHEIYQRETIISDLAELVRLYLHKHRITPYFIVGDKAILQRNATTGKSIRSEYAENRIHIGLSDNSVSVGIDAVSDMLKIRQGIQAPKLLVTENCENLINELKKYEWATFQSNRTADRNNRKEEPKKKDDHACDALRYLVVSRPGSPLAYELETEEFILGTRAVDPEMPRMEIPRSPVLVYESDLGDEW